MVLNSAEKCERVLDSKDCEFIENLLIKNQTILRSVIRSALGEKYDQIGDECISDLYLLMCIKINELRSHESPDGWLVVAARHVANNAARKYNVQLKRTASNEPTDIPSDDDVFESMLYNLYLKAGLIEKLLNSLTPNELKVYNYLYVDCLSCKQVAEIMGVKDSTIRNINANIKKKIQYELNWYDP